MKFKVGDKVKDRDYGKGIIIAVDENALFPYLVDFELKSWFISCYERHLTLVEE